MNILTDFGDAAILLPLSLILTLWLLARRSARSAAWWLIGLALCTGVIALAKIYFFACPIGPELESPSGHTSFSTIVYGAFAAIVVIESSVLWQRILVAGFAVALILAIAVSRLLLGAHSITEIILGLVMGSAGLLVFILGYRRTRIHGGALGLLITPMLVVIALFHGDRLHLEDWFHFLSSLLHIHSVACR